MVLLPSQLESPITHYAIDLDMQISQTSVSLLFEAADKSNFLMWQLNNKNGYMEFKPHYRKNGNWNTLRADNVSGAVVGADTDVQHMRIEVTENEILTYLNGNQLSTIAVSELGGVGMDGTMGRLGFRSHSLEVEAGWMDNIVVTNYTDNEQGMVVKSYDFEDGVNPFDDGAVENGRLNTKYTQEESIALEKKHLPNLWKKPIIR